MIQQEKKVLIERIFDIFNRRALDELDGVFHPGYVDRRPMGDLRGVPVFKAYLKAGSMLSRRQIRALQHDRRWRSGRLAGAPDRHPREADDGDPPTGTSVDVHGLHMGSTSEDGRPSRHWVGNEIAAMLQQLGLMPDMAGAPAAA
jgi:hypothetical protein